MSDDSGWNPTLRARSDVGEISVTVKRLAPLWDGDARLKGEPIERDRVLVQAPPASRPSRAAPRATSVRFG